MAAPKKRPVPKPRPAPFPVPKKPRVAPKGSMYSDRLEDSSGVSGNPFAKPKPKPKTGVSGATYTPKRGTKVTPNARPKGKR